MPTDLESPPGAKVAPPKQASQAGEDTPITLKVNYQGLTRRHKLFLRDMGAATLEPKVREFLQISPDADVLIERYSDSAGSYIVLDGKNVSVYKQLYRAAKAKQKLKLRVTEKEQFQQEKQAPNPVTVENVPEAPRVEAALPVQGLDLSRQAFSDALRTSESKTGNDVESGNELPTTDTGLDFKTSLLASLMKRHHISDDFRGDDSSSIQDKSIKTDTAVSGPGSSAMADDVKAIRSSACGRVPLCPARIPGSLNFAVCCNSCDKTVPESHYHCSTCDDGDFDLCQSCVDQGITCHGEDHWLIKRMVKDGQIVTSTTNTIAPKPKKKEEPKKVPTPFVFENCVSPALAEARPCNLNVRTCNCCVNELPDSSFVHCTTCDDFDLCRTCFAKDGHGHNPKHAFVSAVEGAHVPDHIKVRLAPGRNQMHNAICDGCDGYISGIRNKCLDCPDWDYCSQCVRTAKVAHPGHRFAPIYEPLADIRRSPIMKQVHFGICCDGPLCSPSSYIKGVRYKCAVCHDTDFCANCEASPANKHNKTHPLIQFKTPVRHVSVATTAASADGLPMTPMGDRTQLSFLSHGNDSTSIASVQTVVDVKPVETSPIKEKAVEKTPETQPTIEQDQAVEEPELVPAEEEAFTEKDLAAVFVSEAIADGSTLPPNHVFEQTWVLRNEGHIAWPAGCSVKFVGGDYMGHVDSNQPAGISELVSASESTICYESLAPGQSFPFTVLLRTPARPGNIISYWRLTSKDGLKFGHRLWCDVIVKTPEAVVEKPEEKAKEVKLEPKPAEEKKDGETQMQGSQMIFPKLEKESPESSVHQEVKSEATSEPTLADEAEDDDVDDFEDCGDAAEWGGSDDGFLTDEEYDILDASDEEYLEEQQKQLRK